MLKAKGSGWECETRIAIHPIQKVLVHSHACGAVLQLLTQLMPSCSNQILSQELLVKCSGLSSFMPILSRSKSYVLYLQQAPWQLSPPVHWYCRISLYISYVWQRSHSSGIFCQATWSTCRWPVTLSPSQPRHPLSGRVVLWDGTVQPKVGFWKGP